MDFTRGAARSPGGKAIIALPSAARGGTISRVVARLSPGAGVVTTRGDVDYVVTEYGVAYLHGKSIQERALALISIAHPDFRGRLLQQAITEKYVREEMEDVTGRACPPPQEARRSSSLKDGTVINFRPVHVTDERPIRRFLYALSKEALYRRFMRHMKWIPRRQIRDFVYLDHCNDVAIVGTLADGRREEIIALGCYYLNPRTNHAEVAFVVKDEWQNRGIGSLMLKHLTKIAKQHGIASFTAEVLQDNQAMQALVRKCGCMAGRELNQGVYSYVMDFD